MSTHTYELKAERRDAHGTRASRRLRKEDRLPAVVYGHGQDNASITLPKKQTLEHLHHGAHLFNLTLDGNAESVLLKDVQYDHLGQEVLHLDLFRVNLDEEITSEVPVVLVGEPKGVVAGGTLTQMRDAIELVAKVRDLPDEIRVNVSDLEIGDAIHIGDVKLPAGVRLPEDDAEFTVAMVAAPRVMSDDELATLPTDAPAEPEIIGEKKEPETVGATPEKKKSPNA